MRRARGSECPAGPQGPATTWWCSCGEHGSTTSQPAAARALTAHLTCTGHRSGEYSYGRAGQRTVVEVTVDDGDVVHALAHGPALRP
ncbi:MAG: hypothetical protein GEV09_10055 [Pseudonocardiaceae bacterium]|nr:hypothetical protein [Pseudonocardiaceae bacterium]